MTRFLLTSGLLVSLHLGRYLLAAGGAWALFWRHPERPRTARRRLQHVPFTREDLRRELLASVGTAVLFGLFFGLVYADARPLPLQHPGLLGALEFLAWLALLLVVHDTYFYWSHRLAHHRWLFGLVHALHHRSKNPSPFAALAFHPLEALLQVVWAVPVGLVLPVPTAVWFAFSFAAIFFNVLGHSGVELFPPGWRTHPVLRYLNSATLHDQHHVRVEGNYGLYFTAWDRLMGTLREPPPRG